MAAPPAASPNRLFIGNVPWSTTPEDLRVLFAPCGNITLLEVPTGRQGRSRGYGLIEFSTPQEAQQAIATLDGAPMEDRNINVREDKAPTKSAAPAMKNQNNNRSIADTPAGDGCRVYVGNLAWDTTEDDLIAHCSTAGTVKHSQVARQSSGRSKGWGLVDYNTPEEAANAITQLHNSELQARSVIVRMERVERPAAKSGGGAREGRADRPPRQNPNEGREENSSGLQIVVRNLPWSTTSEDLRQVFQQVGNVMNAESVCHADTGRSKGWGTVLFERADQAQAAISGFNGVKLDQRPMQIKLDRFA